MAIAIKKNQHFDIDNESIVRVKEMGNITEVMYARCRNIICPIRLVDKNHYVIIDTKTGEVSDLYECNHINNRMESLFQVHQSLTRLRTYINTNVFDPKEWKWITLTYAENMKEPKRLYNDFKAFIRALRNKFSKYKIEYIIACEPQGRGAWHIHSLIGFGTIAPYIPNKVIASLWKQGYTKTQKLNDIDNVGAYLTAYLADIEITSDNLSILNENGLKMAKNTLEQQVEIKTITTEDGKSKRYIKGGRLYMYPPNFNLYRISRGIKKPIVKYMEYFDAKIKVGLLRQPTFKTCTLVEHIETGFKNSYAYEYYNKLR